MNRSEIEKHLLKTVKDEITYQCTIGREQNQYTPYSEKEINEFFKKHQLKIESIIQEMVSWEDEEADMNQLMEYNDHVIENIYERIDEIEEYINRP